MLTLVRPTEDNYCSDAGGQITRSRSMKSLGLKSANLAQIIIVCLAQQTKFLQAHLTTYEIA